MKTEVGLVTAAIIFSYLFTLGGFKPSALDGKLPESEVVMTTDTVASDTTLMLPGYTELEDFVIVERKKLIESDGAKLSYNVTEDPEAGSANILEILRKVPGVSVDAEDNVKVNGQSNFKILMNGREDPLLRGDLKVILKSLPSASIKKIEVISEPGAKYEAEGTGGILNIVTDRNKDLSGFMTQLQGWLNAMQAGANFNARTKINKVMLDAGVSYNDGKIWSRPFTSDKETEYITDNENHIELLHRRVKSGWDYAGVRLNLSWEPDTLNLFTLSANYGYNTWGGPMNDHRTMLTKSGDTLWDLVRNVINDGNYTGVGSQLSYQHTFGKEGHNLVISYEFDYSHMNQGTQYRLASLEGILNEYPYSASQIKQRNVLNMFQIDYANPIDSHNLFEAGIKSTLDDTWSLSNSLYGNDVSDAVADPGQRMDLKQFMNIYAAYSSYTGTFDKWSVKAGIRYEHTDMGLKYRTKGHADFTSRLNDIVPNGAVSYNFTSASSLRAAYQMRISRPSMNFINPYINDLTPGWITYGNPHLKSEQSHNVSLAYTNYAGKFGGMVKLSYRFVSNGITDIIFMRDGLINSTYANVGRQEMLALELNGNWNITKDLRWNFYTSGKYEYLKAESELLSAGQHGWGANFNTDVSYTFSFKLRLSGYAGFYTPWIDLQGRGSFGYHYGLGASKSFLKDDALTISLNAGNFFTAVRKNSFTQSGQSVRMKQISYYKPWNVGVSISWKFGGLKTNLKKTSAVIEKEVSSGNTGKNK